MEQNHAKVKQNRPGVVKEHKELSKNPDWSKTMPKLSKTGPELSKKHKELSKNPEWSKTCQVKQNRPGVVKEHKELSKNPEWSKTMPKLSKTGPESPKSIKS
ncbi:hypothetical protein EWI07_01385 [Sporolactobacillus sp. THM7-4]|nr:hypothetical protein EWI07_01385 [Sporolactobacillus sp. THM7-4]